MSCYGVIFTSYRCAEHLEASLRPWIEARKQRLGGHDWLICAVSVPFEGFDNGPDDATRGLLGAAAQYGEIDHVIVRDKPTKETEARGAALQWLVAKGAKILWQADGDEFPTLDEIARTTAFVARAPLVPWFRGSLKNLVFTPDQHLVEPFCPPRIHRVKVAQLTAAGFWDDNNVYYAMPEPAVSGVVKDVEMPHLTVPKAVAWVRHATWLSDERSRRKIDYQVNGRKWPSCSFAWDDARGGLVWNEEHFKRTGQPLPEVARD